MSRFHSYINTAARLIQSYKGEMPFAAFLKNHFAAEKKYGSKDRKQISSLCYSYFRLGAGVKNLPVEERILKGVFLAEEKENSVLGALAPELNEKIALLLEQKLEIIKLNVESIFPFSSALSSAVELMAFSKSFLIQPNLFIRIRPGKRELVFKKLSAKEIPFEIIDEHCLAFANGTKLEDILLVNKEYVVQDYSSQQVGQLFKHVYDRNLPAYKIWDCCAASGGKSILAVDSLPAYHLTVSDVRNSIIHNLKERFKEAAIKNYEAFVADISQPQAKVINQPFDVVICDAPCSGSGTWSRTPESLTYFSAEKIDYYANLQKKIGENAAKFVKQGGYFLYITCSVFTKENEEVVSFLQEKTKLRLIERRAFIGYNKSADTMFAAIFKSS